MGIVLILLLRATVILRKPLHVICFEQLLLGEQISQLFLLFSCFYWIKHLLLLIVIVRIVGNGVALSVGPQYVIWIYFRRLLHYSL